MTKTPTKDLGAIRVAITALQAERQTVQGNTRDQSDLDAERTAYVAQAVEPIATRLHYAVLAGITDDLLIVRPRPDGAVNLGPVLLALLGPDVLADALNRYRGELLPAGGKAQRAARLAEIAAELDRLEDLEEIEVCRLEAQGLQVDRRADARPEIVLAIRS